MKNNIILIFVLLVGILFCDIIPADAEEINYNCTKEEQMRLKQLINSIKINYELIDSKAEDGSTFKTYQLNLIGFTSDIYVYSESDGLLITYDGDNIASTTGVTPGTSFMMPFYASDNTACSNTLITARSVVLPPYNAYSEDPICVGHESYELCKKNSPIVIKSYAEFINRMNAYIKLLQNNNNDNDNDVVVVPEEKSIYDIIVDFLIKNILFITIPIIIAGVVSIIYIEIKKKESIL